MKTVMVGEAERTFPALLEAAAHGEPTIIMQNGTPVALIAPFEDARRLYPVRTASFADFLLSFPEGLDFERDSSTSRSVDL